MNLLDLSGPMQALFTVNRLCEERGLPPPYAIVVASVDGGMVASSAGLMVSSLALSEYKDAALDTLIVSGGCRGEIFIPCPRLAEWIRQHAPDARRVCSVCTGAFLLAEAGVLAGRRATTHWAWAEQLQRRFPEVRVDAAHLFIPDGKVWTSAGVTAGIDMTLALIEEDCGHQLALQTARQLVMFIKRAGGQSQFSVPLAAQSKDGGNFADLHAWVAAHLDEDLSVQRLAAQAGMSPRTFARVYVARMGRTPAKMVEAMRLEAACRMLEDGKLPLKSVAAQAGWQEEQNLRRVFLRLLGITPSQYRERFSAKTGAPEAT